VVIVDDALLLAILTEQEGDPVVLLIAAVEHGTVYALGRTFSAPKICSYGSSSSPTDSGMS
jgi:hypothetical protein